MFQNCIANTSYTLLNHMAYRNLLIYKDPILFYEKKHKCPFTQKDHFLKFLYYLIKKLCKFGHSVFYTKHLHQQSLFNLFSQRF